MHSGTASLKDGASRLRGPHPPAMQNGLVKLSNAWHCMSLSLHIVWLASSMYNNAVYPAYDQHGADLYPKISLGLHWTKANSSA